MKKILFPMIVALTLTACFTDSAITNDEEHYEADGLQLLNEESGAVVAEVVAEGYTASANDTILLSKGDTIHLEAKLLCISNGDLELCSADDHDDHEGHNHAKLTAAEGDHDDHDDDADHDDHDDHGGEALTMKISLSDSTTVGITESDSELYHIGLEGLKVGNSVLSVEFWHGSHIDIEAKEFVVIVE